MCSRGVGRTTEQGGRCGRAGERERIRSRVRAVIGQLEGILRDLKEVAKELREVVEQIDRLTSDFEFELDTDDWTPGTVSSTSSSEKGGPLCDLGPLDFLSSDSWEFCSFLEASTPSDSGDGSDRPSDFRLLNGGATPNGPDSSSEETPIPPQKPPTRTPGSRDRVRFSDKVLYHALCCDDSEDPPFTQDTLRDTPRPAAPSTVLKNKQGGLAGVKKGTRNCSTQTVCDKSTQTVLPYVPKKGKDKR
ncbi:inhibitory synaptic factor 1 [Spea bombifrons]|uniref:inhibitory synaptic factor 1 n=1 Tax=Spea bombifrons TaxID=233779 RepID=UPI00234B20FF|nr:inhibitory synaptic factor 1 [Spea bombifrons]XP_053321006.1 inhibitory synaptic factor 1 [Spea bombifrons]